MLLLFERSRSVGYNEIRMDNQDRKTYVFHVEGMHCASCVVLVENELGGIPEVASAKASLKDLSVEVTGSFRSETPDHVARDLSEVLKPHGYALSLERRKNVTQWSDFKTAFPIAAGFIVLFILLQKLGIVNLVTASEVNYGTAFLIGLIASVSTCMAVVGGLTLSMSANYVKEGERILPQAMFHVGRLASFFLLGGVIGVFGSAFQLSPIGVFSLSLVVAFLLLILGINLLDIFPWAKKLQFTIPSSIGKHVHNLKDINHVLTPSIVGVATFFLPCGFTQSMQIYTLTTGSFLEGALTMFTFALGTFPVLALLSFSSLGIYKKAQSSIFFKTAGIIVIFFGVFNLINAFVAIGFIPPIFNF